ncbi:MAG: hypothetical protein HY268_17905 [Deltaproteobacteria bacterium]|nr:hypothetical protein [Deltaproteobacteria bacterium]
MMRAASYWLLAACSPLVVGCGLRIYPPVAFSENVAPIYPDARPRNCQMLVFANDPPGRPYEVFARITSYGNPPESEEKMQTLIKQNACELGADAVVLLPVQEVEHISNRETYPDWLLGNGTDVGERTQVQVDRRYSLRQRGLAIVFKKVTN